MISGLLATGRTMGAMPVRSAARTRSSQLSTVTVPCSLSSRTQSKPSCPQHFDHRGRWEGNHAAEHGLAGLQFLLEGVFSHSGFLPQVR